MMSQKQRTWMALSLALLCGGAAAYLALGYMRAQAAPAFVAASNRQIAVAAADLPVGTLLRPEHVRLVRWPGEALPQGFYGSVQEVVGRGLTTPVRPNEPLIEGKLAGKGEGGGLPPLIPDGMRALSVSVSQVVAVAGFVIPGSRVDVLLTIDRDGNPVTRAFMQNLTVLAANQSILRDEEGKPVSAGIVTFLVTPEQAEKLTLATREGQLQLTLRNRVDVAESQTRGATRTDLGASIRPTAPNRAPGADAPAPVAQAAPSPAPAPSPRGPVVETYRGGVKSLSTFSNENP
jgi:pilus assembly protein CpaB